VTNLEFNKRERGKLRAVDVTQIPSTGRSAPSTPAEALRRTPLPEASLKAKLRAAGLRPTVQRLSLCKLLFSQNGDRHVSAEALHAEAREAGLRMSLSTVYNALNQFAAAGLLRQIAVQGPRTYFHTRTSPHHHFIDEATGRMFDAADSSVEFARLPAPPEGMEIVGCDVIIRLKRKRG
jgi:Fur family transcriptional regulator, iron response regulator